MSTMKVHRRSSKEFNDAVHTLRVLVPLAHPVKIIRCALKDCWGTCEKKSNPDRFIIRIDKAITDDEAIETLAHEWAHARAWLDNVDDHSPYFGVAYSECYQALYED